ncbi:MAG: WG repeat-containing protein [Crocinitomicaceae bacterium]|nr:WG repeat-containing protein [Crocinitomicaceae bacterium]
MKKDCHFFKTKANCAVFGNYAGEIIIPAEYTYFRYGYFKNGTVIMKKGEIIAPFLYDVLYNFRNGYALGKRDGNYFFINRMGKEVLSSQDK